MSKELEENLINMHIDEEKDVLSIKRKKNKKRDKDNS